MKGILIVVLASSVFGCPSKQKDKKAVKQVIIISIDVVDRTTKGHQVRGITDEVIQGWIEQKLKTSRPIKLSLEAKSGHQLKIEFGIGDRENDLGKIERVVAISARATNPDDLDCVILHSSGIHPMPKETPENKQRSKIRKVLLKIMDELDYQGGLAMASPDELIRALKIKDVHRLSAAVEIAATRQLKKTVPQLITLLKHEEKKIADRAIGALVAIGDQRAVKPLTRLSQFKDTSKMAKILDGIGTLGGKEARQYLEFVSSGHEDADIRNLASEALVRLKKREARKNFKKK
jgi:hypothetical protein